MQQGGIFRKVALERLSSPEQLDAVMEVMHPRSWIALGGLLLLVAIAGIWAFLGSIPTKIQAQGVIIKPGGVFDVVATGSGPLVEMTVTEGDMVTKGQAIGRIDYPDLRTEIEAAKAELGERSAEHGKLTAFATQDLSLRSDVLRLQEAKIKETIAFAQQRVAALRQKIESEEILAEKGLLTNQAILPSRQDLFAAQDMLQRSLSELKQLPIDDSLTTRSRESDIVRGQMGINDVRRHVDGLEQRYKTLSTVVSPYTGRILELKRKRGDVLGVGTPVASLQLADADVEGLQIIIYVPPSQGKNVSPGLDVQISPTTAPREEFGYMLGTVTSVSEFPATSEGMMRVLSNQGLVQSLSAEGPPFAVYAELERDRSATSGYKWSSPKGSALTVNSGTLCNVTVTVRSRRPIDLVVPILRQYAGL